MKHLFLKHEDYTISLLTDDEFIRYNSLIPLADDWWWLKPATVVNQKSDDEKPDAGTVKFINLEGHKNDLGWEPFYRIGVRPVIKYRLAGLNPGERFSALGNRWVVLDDGVALSLDTICHRRIDASAAYWEKVLKTKENRCCELKTWLEEWAKDGEENE